MAETPLIRTTLLVALIVAFGLAAASRAPAADQGPQMIQVAASDSGSRFVPLGIGKSVVIDLPRDVKDVLVADPKIANAVIRSTRRAYIIGSTVGQTNVFFFDHSGQQIIGLDIAVTRDLNGLRAAIRQALPNSDIRVEGLGEGLVLTGNVATPLEAQTAFDIASRLTGEAAKVVNAITVHGRDQVMLKVTVAEIQRDVIKQLGINLAGQFGSGASVLKFNTDNPFGAHGQALSDSKIEPTFGNIGNRVTATIRAMERAGVIRTLAEPSLTAISGESSSFLAGGEFPVPAGRTCDPVTLICTDSIQWKKFGVGLNFTPVVLGEGRISLRVQTEVSELSTEAAVQLQGLTIPSLRVRRADTTVEIPSGGALAMAGMIQEQTKQQMNGLPGLMQVPVLGTLFKSRDFVNRQTELVVIVTPFVVRAVAQRNLSRPDDGFADPSDPASILLGRLNRIYGVPKPKDQLIKHSNYRGNYGFILD
ncbi:MAG: BON domain-containing protein [Rhizobiales bacterium]|nr:BON domain-containing protein [Hyphomicrobiales bacterium]